MQGHVHHTINTHNICTTGSLLHNAAASVMMRAASPGWRPHYTDAAHSHFDWFGRHTVGHIPHYRATLVRAFQSFRAPAQRFSTLLKHPPTPVRVFLGFGCQWLVDASVCAACVERGGDFTSKLICVARHRFSVPAVELSVRTSDESDVGLPARTRI